VWTIASWWQELQGINVFCVSNGGADYLDANAKGGEALGGNNGVVLC
jgi:hypothetical protein